jgi:LmbE family N-acetylglucosaminyl deacetylase
MNKKKNILVIAAHPDDEALGCAGTIAKHIDSKENVKIVFFTDGEMSRDNANKKLVSSRKKNAIKSLKILGVKEKDVIFNSFPDNAMDGMPLIKIVKILEHIKKNYKPDIIYTHYGNDLNVDHKAVYNATLVAFRPVPSSTVKKILCFEVLSSTEWASKISNSFNPNYFVNINKFLKKKIASIKKYKKEIQAEPHPRSIKNVKNLAGFRGMSCGVKYVEAFYAERIID